jgi:hypothetical protein
MGNVYYPEKVNFMSHVQISYSDAVIPTGETVRLAYYEEDDMLELFFGPNEPATGVELTEHILLRVNRTTGRAVSLTLRHFSILVEHTLYGPRSYPLEHLDQLPETLQETVLHLLNTPPVNQFLKLSHVQLSPARQMPVAYVAVPDQNSLHRTAGPILTGHAGRKTEAGTSHESA